MSCFSFLNYFKTKKLRINCFVYFLDNYSSDDIPNDNLDIIASEILNNFSITELDYHPYHLSPKKNPESSYSNVFILKRYVLKMILNNNSKFHFESPSFVPPLEQWIHILGVYQHNIFNINETYTIQLEWFVIKYEDILLKIEYFEYFKSKIKLLGKLNKNLLQNIGLNIFNFNNEFELILLKKKAKKMYILLNNWFTHTCLSNKNTIAIHI